MNTVISLQLLVTEGLGQTTVCFLGVIVMAGIGARPTASLEYSPNLSHTLLPGTICKEYLQLSSTAPTSKIRNIGRSMTSSERGISTLHW